MMKTEVAIKPAQFQLDRGITRNVCVVEFYAVARTPGVIGLSHLEVHIAPEADDTAPRIRMVTTTADPADPIVRRVQEAYGTHQRFDVTWHRTRRGPRWYFVMDRVDRCG